MRVLEKRGGRSPRGRSREERRAHESETAITLPKKMHRFYTPETSPVERRKERSSPAGDNSLTRLFSPGKSRTLLVLRPERNTCSRAPRRRFFRCQNSSDDRSSVAVKEIREIHEPSTILQKPNMRNNFFTNSSHPLSFCCD